MDSVLVSEQFIFLLVELRCQSQGLNCFKQIIIHSVFYVILKTDCENCPIQICLEILPGVPESLGLALRMFSHGFSTISVTSGSTLNFLR